MGLTLKSTGKIFASFIVGLVAIVALIFGTFYGYNFIQGWRTLTKVNTALTWIENFYTTQDRYPTKDEFNQQFPNFSDIGSHAIYNDGYGSLSPQTYSLSYNLTLKNAKAPGNPNSGFGYSGFYTAWACKRQWPLLPNMSDSNKADIYIAHPWGSLFADFYTGQVYFQHFDGNKLVGEKIVVLKNVQHPRIFGSDKKVVITHGTDVYSYDWDGVKIALSNPQKIGTVPTGCIDGSHNSAY